MAAVSLACSTPKSLFACHAQAADDPLRLAGSFGLLLLVVRFIKFLKTLFRSRSLDFALHSNRPPSPHEVRTLLRKGVLIHYRPGGSDVETS